MPETLPQTDPTSLPKQFDEQGKLPITQSVPNKDLPHVHPSDIIDKGTAVSKIEEPKKEKEPAKPEENAQNQTDKLEEIKEASKLEAANNEESLDSRNNPVPTPDAQDRLKSKVVSSLSTVGNPLSMPANHLIGDKVYDICHDGSAKLKIQNGDKSRTFCLDETPHSSDEDGNIITKMKVHVQFPSISSKVSQRALLIKIKSNKENENESNGSNKYEDAHLFFPPDVSSVDILVPLAQCIHLELNHLDTSGRPIDNSPYLIDFYSVHGLSMHPLEPSPILVELQTNTIVNEE